MKKTGWILVMIFLLVQATANAEQYAPEDTNRVRRSLNWEKDSFWKFNFFGPNAINDLAPAGTEDVTYDTSTWKNVSIPHNWSCYDTSGDIHPFILENPPQDRTVNGGGCATEGWGVYRKHFTVDSEYSDKKVFVEFQGVMLYCDVYINENLAGFYKGGYLGFSMDITDHVNFGGENLLAVKVMNYSGYGGIPPCSAGLYNLYGGIYRDVDLVITDKLYVPYQGSENHEGGTFVTTPVASALQAQVNVLTYVKNDYASAMDCTVVTYIVDAASEVVKTMQTMLTVNPGEIKEFDQTSTVISNPNLWHPDTPYLYRVYTTVRDSSTAVDSYKSPLGIRWYSWDSGPDRLTLNGTVIHLHGICRHQDYPWLGSAIPKWMHKKDYEDQKFNHNANFLRPAHYPNDPYVLDLCDELGIILNEEVPCGKSINWNVTVVEQMTREMVRRDRNHPCVIFWSMGNETSSASNCAWAVEEDPTRIIYCRKCSGFVGGGSMGCIDVDGDESTMEMENVMRLNIRGWRGDPWPVDARGDGQTPIREDKHSEYATPPPGGNTRSDITGNGAAWIYADFGANRIYHPAVPWEDTNPKGYVDFYRQPKYSWYLWRAYWGPDDPMIFIQPHYWVPAQIGTQKEIIAFSNCDTVQLYIGGISYGSAEVPNTYGFVTWSDVPVTNADLSAYGVKDLIYSTSTVVAMSGSPSKLVLSASHSEVIANYTDISIITVDIQDSNGKQIIGATNTIVWSISGPGTLVAYSIYETDINDVGATNNNPTGYTITPVCMPIRSTGTNGTITVTATSNGLSQAQIQVISEPAGVTAPTHIVSTADPTSIYADGGSLSEITAMIKDMSEFTVTTATHTITFSITGPGSLVGSTTRAPTDGIATINLTSTLITGTVTVTATADGLDEGSADVTTLDPPVPTSLINTASPLTIVADGSTTSLITCTILDQHVMHLTTATNMIIFSVTGEGSLIAPTSGQASGGIATVELQSTTTIGTATITATSDDLGQGTAAVTSTPGPEAKLVNTAQPQIIDADGSSTSTITVQVSDVNNNPITTVGGGFTGWSDWSYRKPITITNSGSELNDYQVGITLTLATFDYIKCQALGEDIRFTGDDEVTELSYWIQTWDTGGDSIVYVKVSTVAASPQDTTIYMYYGNTGASSLSNANSTFDFYSDGSSLSGWTNSGASVDGTLGQPSPSLQATGGNYACQDVGLTVNQILEFDCRVIPGGTTLCDMFFLANSAGSGQMFRLETRGGFETGFAGTTNWSTWGDPSGQPVVTAGVWHGVKIEIGATTAYAYINGSSYGSYGFSNNGGWIAVHGDGAAVTGGNYDNIRVRKYASSEPTAQIGTEEEGGVGPITFSLTGEGTLVGTNVKDMVEGSATILLQSTMAAGTATVTATTDGLDEGSVEVTIAQGDPEKIISTADTMSIKADGSSTSLITARVCDDGDNTVTTAVNTITFSVSGEGSLLGTTTNPADAGVATVQLQSTTSHGTATVTATSADLGQDAVAVTTTRHLEKVLLSAVPASLESDGTSTSLITASILDAGDVVVTDATNTITFSMTGEGSLVGTTSKAASGGIATVQLKSTMTEGTATVTATSDNLEVDSIDVVISGMEPPANLRAEDNNITKHSITLEWDEGDAESDVYKIERSSDGGSSYEVIVSTSAGLAATTHMDENLYEGTEYKYKVYGYNIGQGKMSGPSGTLTKSTESVDDRNRVNSNELEIVDLSPLKVEVTIEAGTLLRDSYLEYIEGFISTDADDNIGEFKKVPGNTEINAYERNGVVLVEADYKKEMVLKLYYTVAEIGEGIDEDSLRIFVLDEDNNRWERVPGEQDVDKKDKSVTVIIEHFSVYCLMGSGDQMKVFNMANYPNPMTGETVFTFEITKDADVKLAVYTVSGRLVKSFPEVKGMYAGYNEIPVSGTWDGKDAGEKQLAPGVYLWKVTATPVDGGTAGTATGKLVIIR